MPAAKKRAAATSPRTRRAPTPPGASRQDGGVDAGHPVRAGVKAPAAMGDSASVTALAAIPAAKAARAAKR